MIMNTKSEAGLDPSVFDPAPAFLGRVGGDVAGQLERSIDRRSRELESRNRDLRLAARDTAAIRRLQADIRGRAARAIGGPLPEIGDVHAREVRTITVGNFSVQTAVIEDDRGVRIPTTTMRRESKSAHASPAVLLIPGHGDRLSKRNLDFAATIANSGFVVTTLESWGQGERSDFRDASGRSTLTLEPDDILPVLEHNCAAMAHWALGDSLARQMVQDARAALRYLCSRPDVDAARVGVTGASGGGLLTTWLMMLEPLLAAAAPLIFVTEQRAIRDSGIPQCGEQVALGDGVSWLDHADALISMTPRPVFVGSGEYDFFPLAGARRSIADARRCYEVFGAEQNIRHELFAAGHDVPPSMMRAVAEFFSVHLGGGRVELVSEAWPVHQMGASESGFLALDAAAGASLGDVARAGLALPTQRPREEEVRSWLAARIPTPHPGLAAKWTSSRAYELDGMAVTRQDGFWAGEDEVCSAGVLWEPSNGATEAVVALFDRGTDDISMHASWIRGILSSGRAVLAVDVRGTGSVTPRSRNWFPLDGNYGTLFAMNMDLLRLGESLAVGRTGDVLAALEIARHRYDVPVIESWGFANHHALLASYLDERVGLVVHGPVESAEEAVAAGGAVAPRQWQHLIPGIARHAPIDVVKTAMRERLREFPHEEAENE